MYESTKFELTDNMILILLFFFNKEHKGRLNPIAAKLFIIIGKIYGIASTLKQSWIFKCVAVATASAADKTWIFKRFYSSAMPAIPRNMDL